MTDNKDVYQKIFLALMTNAHATLKCADECKDLSHEETQNYVLHIFKNYAKYFGIDT